MLLANGALVSQAALKAGVSERTIYRRLQQPEFQARIDAFQEETLQRAAAVLTAAAQEGIRSLVALQDSATPPNVRRAAARDILDMSLRLREAADLEKRLVVVENQAEGHPVASVPAGPVPPGPKLKRTRRGDATVLLALASGSTVTQAAAKACLSERTVYRRLQDPAFHHRIEVLRADMVQRAAALLIAATLLASKTLIELQNSATLPSVRRRAARDIIEMSQKLRQATVVEKRLAALEAKQSIPFT